MQGFDPTVPNVARMYDYMLGGKDSFAADREAADRLMALAPDAVKAARDNRGFLQRAVRFLAGEAGIEQFIDIGSGLPTQENVHEVARVYNPYSRVAYVDYDAVVVSHAANRLVSDEGVIAVQGDLRDPKGILGNGALRELIDLGQPVAVTLVAILHFLDHPDAYRAVEYLKDMMAPGSYLAISHATPDEAGDGEADKVTSMYSQASAHLFLRPLGQIRPFFEGLELVDPGIVAVGNWLAEERAVGRVIFYGGVGRKA